AGVIVVVLRRRRNPCSNKNNLPLGLAIATFGRDVEVAKVVGLWRALNSHFKRTLGGVRLCRNNLKSLQKSAMVARALEAISLKMRRQITRGNGKARRK